MLNKIGKVLLIVCLILVVWLIYTVEHSDGFFGLPKAGIIILGLIFVIGFSSSFSLIFYQSVITKQKRIIIILSIICGLILTFGVFSNKMLWPAANLEVIISIFLFCFGALPLIIKLRYKKRSAILSKTALIWSFTDLFAVLFLCLGALFKFMHWPGSSVLVPLGIAFLVISMFGWNISFKKEVNLKLEAEQRLKETLKNLEEKNRLIQEKQKEILDSIKYAKRIQQAHLPNEKMITKTLKRLK